MWKNIRKKIDKWLGIPQHTGNQTNPVMTSHTKFFHFWQNNSGGRFDVDDVVDEGGVVFEAKDAKEANKRAKKAGVFSRSFCECCGPRFFTCSEAEKGFDSVEEAVSSDRPVVVHFKDGTSKRFTKSDEA